MDFPNFHVWGVRGFIEVSVFFRLYVHLPTTGFAISYIFKTNSPTLKSLKISWKKMMGWKNVVFFVFASLHNCKRNLKTNICPENWCWKMIHFLFKKVPFQGTFIHFRRGGIYVNFPFPNSTGKLTNISTSILTLPEAAPGSFCQAPQEFWSDYMPVEKITQKP